MDRPVRGRRGFWPSCVADDRSAGVAAPSRGNRSSKVGAKATPPTLAREFGGCPYRRRDHVDGDELLGGKPSDGISGGMEYRIE